MKQEFQCLIMIRKHEKVMNVEARPRRLSLSKVQTRGTSVSYNCSNSWANRRVTFLFTVVELIIQMVIYLFATKLVDFEVKDWNST